LFEQTVILFANVSDCKKLPRLVSEYIKPSTGVRRESLIGVAPLCCNMAEESQDTSEDVEQLNRFFEEVRESFRVSMAAEGVDRETRDEVIKTVEDNL